MERMHRHVFALGLSLAAIALMATDSRAALLHPNDTSQFPDASGGFVSGTLGYNASTGVFSMQNTPFALALGTSAATQFDISATPGGQRSETLSVQLNPDGTVNQAADGRALQPEVGREFGHRRFPITQYPQHAQLRQRQILFGGYPAQQGRHRE